MAAARSILRRSRADSVSLGCWREGRVSRAGREKEGMGRREDWRGERGAIVDPRGVKEANVDPRGVKGAIVEPRGVNGVNVDPRGDGKGVFMGNGAFEGKGGLDDNGRFVDVGRGDRGGVRR